MNVKDKFKNAWWFPIFCEKDCLTIVLYDFAPRGGNNWPSAYRPLFETPYRRDQAAAYHSVNWDHTYDHQNKLTHEELYEVVQAAFELGFIKEAMEAKQMLDRIHVPED